MQNNQTLTNQKHSSNDWSFMPRLLSGFAGVGIGIVIGNFLGWI